MALRSYRWLVFAGAVAAFAADQASKYGMFKALYQPGHTLGQREVAKDWFRFCAEYDPSLKPCDCWMHSLQTWSAPDLPRVNQGALFGLGGEHKGLANQVFAGVSILAAAGILVWAFRRGSQADGWLCLALGLILGGTLGNLYDRLVFNGVRDFLHMYHEINLGVWASKDGWPVFNIADCALVCGAAMLLVHAFVFPAERPAPTPTGSTTL